MLRNLPKFKYSGLTVVLSNRSRFDLTELLSAAAGNWFNQECLRPELNRYQTDIRLAIDRSPLLEGTKAILLLGEESLHRWTSTSLSLAEVRGTPLYTKEHNIPAIATFLPQDAMDIRDFESELNEHAGANNDDFIKAPEYLGEKKHGKTQRSNFRYWIKSDTARLKQVLLSADGKFPEDDIEPEYIIYPNLEELILLLENTKNQNIYLDLETDENLNIRCIGISITDL